MRKIICLFGSMLILVLLLSNCEKEKVDTNDNQIDQTILFQYEYTNYAWGFIHVGWLIDSSGKVYCYWWPDNWIHGDSLGFIKDSVMINNLAQIDSICYNIDKQELMSKYALIDNAAKGFISEPIHAMYDGGVTGYYGFTYDKDTQMYKRVLLKQFGNYRIDNISEEAIDLYNWLDDINIRMRKIE